MTPDEWEAMCDGCGKCCAFGDSNVACPSLNVKTNRCIRYNGRLLREMCMPVIPSNVLTLHGMGVLPDSCAYVRHTLKKPPLETIEKAALMPFAKASLSVRRAYARNRRLYLKLLQEMLGG